MEHDLAKVGVAGSSPVSRSFYFESAAFAAFFFFLLGFLPYLIYNSIGTLCGKREACENETLEEEAGGPAV